ncbi:MAG: hypothetical protein M3442_11010 [Chloroflexota bacterium]|nr:hypothetical protein [Chloroflexota bacterium]
MPRHPNFMRTQRKQVFLSSETRTTIQSWADRQGVSFSAAIEALARSSLRRALGGAATRAPEAPLAGASPTVVPTAQK